MGIVKIVEPDIVGFRLEAWCRSVGISRSGYYNLEIEPHSVKIGERRIITETPREYLARVATFKQKEQPRVKAAA